MASQIAQHQRLVTKTAQQIELLEQVAGRITSCFENGGRLFVFGNGGSAADAQHIAAELVGRFKHDRKALPAIALTTDTSILTAVANDMGSEYGFSRQVQALVTDRDMVWALSVSGRSANVIRALEAARAAGATLIGFTGRDGEPLRELCELCFVVDEQESDRVQEMHQLGYHLVCDSVERHYR